MTWIFLILLSIARWHIFWCHTDTWFSLKENEDSLSFCLVKLKLAFKNTIFWCWIRALIDTSHFVICHWLNVKHTVHQNIFQYHSAIWDGFFKNIQNLQSWTKLLRQNGKSILQWRNPSSPKTMLFAKF